MHSKAMWPIHGKYICPDCLREYPVGWTEAQRAEQAYAATAQASVWQSKAPAANERLGTS